MANKNPYLKDRDILDQALEHSWGKTADAKAKEKAYNREYYQRHKEEILRRARKAGEGIQRTAQNVSNDVRTAFRKDRKWSHTTPPTRVETSDLAKMNSRLRNEGRARYNEAARNADELSRYERNYRQGRAHNPNYTREYNEYIGREANRAIDESNRAYKNASRMAKRASSSGAAANEASKATDAFYKGPYDKRFDSKLARDAQNAYSKLRNPKEMARRAGETAKKAYNQAADYLGTAANRFGRHPGEHSPTINDVERYRNADAMNSRLLGEAKNRRTNAANEVNKSDARTRRFAKASGAEYDKYRSESERADALDSDRNTKGYAKDARDTAKKHKDKAYEYSRQAIKAGQETYENIKAHDRAAKNQSRMAERKRSSGTALNEAEKARRVNTQGAYNVRYDTKLARDVQNARAKARDIKNNPGKYVNRAKSSAEKAAENAREEAKKRMKKWFKR